MVTAVNALGNLLPGIVTAFDALGTGIYQMEEGAETFRAEVSEVLRATSTFDFLLSIRERETIPRKIPWLVK